jgi:hypothetical protein
LRDASAAVQLSVPNSDFLPAAVDVRALRAQVLVDAAQLSAAGVVGQLKAEASAERLFVGRGEQRAGAEDITLTIASDATVASPHAATPLRVALAARRVSAAQRATRSALEGRDFALEGAMQANSGAPSNLKPAAADALSVRFSELAYTQRPAITARLHGLVMQAQGPGLVSALTTNAPANATVSVRARRIEARAGQNALELTPAELVLRPRDLLRSEAGEFGLAGRLEAQLKGALRLRSGAQSVKLGGFAPAITADFDRGRFEGQLPIARLDVRQDGHATLALRGAALRFALADPLRLAPPDARGRVSIDGAVNHVASGDQALALPQLALSLQGEGGAYAIAGSASVAELRSSSRRFAGTHRFALSGRADLATHVADLQAQLVAAHGAKHRPGFDASLHAAIDASTGAFENRFELATHQLAPVIASYLPEGASLALGDLRMRGEGRWSGLFAAPLVAGQLPQLSPDALEQLRGAQQFELSALGVSLVRGGREQFGCPAGVLSLSASKRADGAVVELTGHVADLVVRNAARELRLSELRPRLSVHLPDPARPRVAAITAEVTLANVAQNVVPGYPLSSLRLTAALDSAPGRSVLRELVLSNGGGHARLRMTGAYESQRDAAATAPRVATETSLEGREAFSLSGELEQDLSSLTGSAFARHASGRLRVPFEVQSGDLQSVRAVARLVAEAVDFTSPDGSLAVERLNGEIPIAQTLTLLPSGALLDPGAGENALSRARFPDVQPFLNNEAFLTAERIVSKGQVLGPLAGNVRIAGTTLAVDRLQVGYRGGSITGQLAADLRPGAAQLSFRGNATGIHTARGGKDVLDANLALRFVPASLALDGTMQMVRVSKSHLRELLDALDPYHEDPQMNKLRLLLSFGYPRFARLRAAEGLMDFEVSLGGLAGAVSIDAIRAIPIAPLLDVYAAPLVDAWFPGESAM